MYKRLTVGILAVLFVLAMTIPPTVSAEEPSSVKSVSKSMGVIDGPALSPGWNWDHCSQTWHSLGSAWNYCYFENTNVWVGTNDPIAADTLTQCTASYNWCAIYVTGESSWNAIILYKF